MNKKNLNIIILVKIACFTFGFLFGMVSFAKSECRTPDPDNNPQWVQNSTTTYVYDSTITSEQIGVIRAFVTPELK